MIDPKALNRVSHQLAACGCVLGCAGLLWLSGCKYSSVPGGDLIESEQIPRNIDYITAAQAATGARADAMLYPRHFDGARLNSLGRAKLHLMVMDKPEGQPLAIFLNVPEGQGTAPLRNSVESYLQEQGLAEADYQLKNGPNPDTYTPANIGLTRMAKTEGSSGMDTKAGYSASESTDSRSESMTGK